jgi:hypothetical protein
LAEGPVELDERFPIPSDVRAILERISRPTEPGIYERFCRAANRVFGGVTKNMKLTEETLKTLKRAKLRVKPGEWWAGFLLLLMLPTLPCTFTWLGLGLLGADMLSLLYLPLLGLLLAGLFAVLFQTYPSSSAAMRASEAQSQAINTIMLLSFALYHRPDLRGATVYAADVGKGKLAEDLQRGLLELDEKRRYETVRHLLTVLAHEWGEIDEGTRRAIFDVLRSTGMREEAARLADIAKAPGRVFESTEEQLGRRLNSLVMPTMAFLVFGSLAIVGAVGLAPIFGMIGMNFLDLKFFVLVTAALVAAFLLFTTYMGKRRPITLPPPEIPAKDPRLPPPRKAKIFGKLVPIWLPSVAIFIALAWPGVLYLAGFTSGILGDIALSFTTLWLVWAVAATIAVYAYLYSARRLKLREEERRKLTDWEVALNTMGSRVLDGKPMGQAMNDAAELMAGSPLAEQLKQTSATMDRLGIDMYRALFERGAAKNIHNPLVASFLDIISRIRRGSEAAAGRACMMAAEFLGTLHRVEARFKEKIDEALGNLWLVAILLLPIICAMSIWVMEFMSGISLTTAAQTRGAGLAGLPFIFGEMEFRELAMLKLLMGLTAIALALVIARYIATIRAGDDKLEFWKTAGKSVLLTALVFTAAYIIFGMIKASA